MISSVAERARKLRAQYSLQANGLRTRLEIRVNRIPHRMRTQLMGATLDKFSNQRLSSTAILPGMAAPSPVKQRPVAKKAASSKRDRYECGIPNNEDVQSTNNNLVTKWRTRKTTMWTIQRSASRRHQVLELFPVRNKPKSVRCYLRVRTTRMTVSSQARRGHQRTWVHHHQSHRSRAQFRQ